MPWVVDTNVLIDILEDDPRFGARSAAAVDERRSEGLVICPVTYVEMAPAFGGSRDLEEEFLAGLGADFLEEWTWEDSVAAHAGWCRHVERRRAGRALRRPLADILIGAFASRFRGVLTRNPGDFRPAYPDLPVVTP